MSHGRLVHHQAKSSTELRDIATARLVAELLGRLDDRQDTASRADLERDLSLLDTLHDRTGRLCEVAENRRSATHLGSVFRYLEGCCKRFPIRMHEGVHVDIGCGSINPYARMFTHLMLGAARGHCIDLDQVADDGAAIRALARLAAAAVLTPRRLFHDHPIDAQRILGNLGGFDLARLELGEADAIDRKRLVFHQRPIEDTGLDTGSVDLVVSNSVFEHLPDVDAVLAELARITRHGGHGVHGIDTVDHRWYGDPSLHPYEFLTIDSNERIVHGCNRLRLFEYRPLFERHGFEILDHQVVQKLEIPAEFRARMREPWRSQPDEWLEHSWAHVLVRRR
ncbi:MAG: class I SAM-dependent methyltransferase [Planctomycetes bacterium]|nr:class I SAM-dependent methyltransferase [Planctomycetota bacterium]